MDSVEQGVVRESVKLEKGDCFVVKTDGAVSAPIRLVEKVKDLCGEAVYNHAGIIISEAGDTFESLQRIDHYTIHDYKGSQILIFRHISMTDTLFEKGWAAIAGYDGKMYPWWRMPLFLLGIAKWVHCTYPVCSELLKKFEWGCGIVKHWAGYTPDNIADEVAISRYYTVKYEGVL